MIKQCVCDHPYQDQKYGYKNRVFNQTVKNVGEFRRTVCERIYKPIKEAKKVNAKN